MKPLPTDPLTGLEVLTDATVEALLPGSTLAYIDLVHFRDRVNAPFDHVVGDSVLSEAARRLGEALAPWRVFRSAGDEFTVEVAEALDREGAERLAGRVAAALALPFEQTGAGLEATVGVCLQVVGEEPWAVWSAARRAADTEAPRLGARLWVVSAA